MAPYSSEVLSLINELEENKQSDIHFWTFGESVRRISSQSLTYSDKLSDYSEFFSKIQSNYYANQISTVVLIGDGIFNAGTDPIYEVRDLPYPINSIGVGDTTRYADLLIKSVKSNQTVFLGDAFPIEIDIEANSLQGKDFKLSVIHEKSIIYEDDISINTSTFHTKSLLHLNATKPGMQHYTIELTVLNDEKNEQNNTRNFTINVIDKKQKILMLSGATHPDMAAINRALSTKTNYEVVQYDANAKDNEELLNQLDLVIVNQLPNRHKSYSQVLNQLEKKRIPILWSLGTQTDISSINELNNGIEIRNYKGYEYTTAEAVQNFHLFKIDANSLISFKDFPPLYAPFAELSLKDVTYPLFTQKIRNISTSSPLLTLGTHNNTRYGVINGEGIWRWRINDYLQHGNFNNFDSIFNKIINYLILKPNEDGFRLIAKQNFRENEDVLIEAELLNDNYEPTNIPDVNLNISNELNLNIDFVMDKVGSHYIINAGKLESGKYIAKAKTSLGAETHYEELVFEVTKFEIENQTTEANFKKLKQIAESSGGIFIPINKAKDSINNILSSNKSSNHEYKREVYIPFISLKWIALVIIILLCIEWFLRKYWGAY